MIEINLLPENLRRSEGTPLPRQLAIYLGVALSLGLIFLNYHYFMKTKLANKELAQLRSEMAEVKKQEEELKEIQEEIAGIEQHVEAVEKLYRDRIVWAKLLQDLKSVINNQGYNRSNADAEYIWLEEMSLDGGGSKNDDGPSQYLVLQGIASAGGTRKATKMVQDLLAGMVSHTPDAGEEEEKEELSDEETAEQALLEKEAAGADLTVEEKRRLEAIKERQEFSQRHQSGDIAEKGFYDFFAEGARTVETDWNDSLGSSRKGETNMENMPQQGMDFEIRLGFKPKVKVDEDKKRGF